VSGSTEPRLGLCETRRRVRATTRIAALVLAIILGTTAFAQHLVVIVNPASKVETLSRAQALDIFLGRYRKLPSGSTAMPLDLRDNAPERAQFYLNLAHMDTAAVQSYWARLVFSGKASPPFQVDDPLTAIELVATNPNAIAYVDRSLVSSRVKVVLDLSR
jgi:hypothetical protein